MNNKNKILLSLSTVFLILSFTGCEDDTSNCKFDVQQALDKDNNAYVINRLETDATCVNDYTNNSQYIDLANAYLGAAGVNLSTIIKAMSKDQSDFSGILSDLSANQNINTFKFLENSELNYQNYLDKNIEDCATSLSYETKELCFYKGLNSMFKISNTLTFLTDNVSGWNTGVLRPLEDLNQNKIPDDMDNFNCSAEYGILSLNGNYNCPTQTNLTGTSTLVEIDNALQIGSNTYQYILTGLTDGINTNENNYLIANRNVIMTSGFCSVNRESCNDGDIGCYPCPVENSNGLPIGLNDSIVDSLNSSLSLIEGSADNELGGTIDSIRSEIKSDPNDNSPITTEDIQNYLEGK